MIKRMRFSIVFRLATLFSAFALLSFVPVRKKKHRPSPGQSNVLVKKQLTKDSTEHHYYIIISKRDYELKVYDDEGWYATYPIVFGSRDLGDKMREGDKRTPNGNFKVILKKIHPQWGPELLLDYPNEESYQKFNERKAGGLIPGTAKIGGGIAIHATRPQEEWTVDNYYNWTDGCISAKYSEMQELYSYIPLGTPVTIRP
jgi:murein L,D-transpeptidase YafK